MFVFCRYKRTVEARTALVKERALEDLKEQEEAEIKRVHDEAAQEEAEQQQQQQQQQQQEEASAPAS
jgi:hypothetical protein